jgi:hypothetical protein
VGIDAADTLRLVRRPRANVRTDPPDLPNPEVPSEPTLHETRIVTGITVGNDQMMARIYDKTIELQKKPREQDRTEEYERWAAGGWDGKERVARIEFQIRGTALQTFGARDPVAPIDPETGEVVRGRLCAYVDRLWQACLNWIRLVVPETTRGGTPKPISGLRDDPRWALLRGITFTVDRVPPPARRRRLRGGCSAMQELDAVVSTLASRGLLCTMDEHRSSHGESAEATLSAMLQTMHAKAADIIADELVDRWASATKACAARASLGVLGHHHDPVPRRPALVVYCADACERAGVAIAGYLPQYPWHDPRPNPDVMRSSD